MNVLVVGKFYRDSFGLYIAETLNRMGQDVRRFEPGVRHRSRGKLHPRRMRLKLLLDTPAGQAQGFPLPSIADLA